jgi:hypothetical protein
MNTQLAQARCYKRSRLLLFVGELRPPMDASSRLDDLVTDGSRCI